MTRQSELPSCPQRPAADPAHQGAKNAPRWGFPGDTDGSFLVSSLDHQNAEHGEFLEMILYAQRGELSDEFVIHSLRHTVLTRLGESGAEAFTIMRIAGHSSSTVSEGYVHPSPESLENAIKRMDDVNRAGLSAAATNSATEESDSDYSEAGTKEVIAP